MVKRTNQVSYLSGNNAVSPALSFIYQISLCKIYKGRFELVGIKTYSSKEKLNIKKNAVYKREKDYILVKYIDWIGAPMEYILNNNFINSEEICQKKVKAQ